METQHVCVCVCVCVLHPQQGWMVSWTLKEEIIKLVTVDMTRRAPMTQFHSGTAVLLTVGCTRVRMEWGGGRMSRIYQLALLPITNPACAWWSIMYLNPFLCLLCHHHGQPNKEKNTAAWCCMYWRFIIYSQWLYSQYKINQHLESLDYLLAFSAFYLVIKLGWCH